VLVEKEDFAAGTSSRSTKLVHGGVRYLEKAFKNLDYGQLKLVFEALHERKIVLDSAPHLATTLPIMTVREYPAECVPGLHARLHCCCPGWACRSGQSPGCHSDTAACDCYRYAPYDNSFFRSFNF